MTSLPTGKTNGTASTVGDIDRAIDDLWSQSSNAIEAIDPATTNWKSQVLPLARIKKIMKSDEAIYAELEREQNTSGDSPSAPSNPRFMIAGEAPILLGKACEMLVKELSIRAWRHTERHRRRTLQKQDVHAAVGESEVYDFLIDIVPRVPIQSSKSYGTEQSQVPNSSVSSDTSTVGHIPAPSMGHIPTPTIGHIPAATVANEQVLNSQGADMTNLAHMQHMQYNIMMQQQQQMQVDAVTQAAVGGTTDPKLQQPPQQMMIPPHMYMQPTIPWQPQQVTQQHPQSVAVPMQHQQQQQQQQQQQPAPATMQHHTTPATMQHQPVSAPMQQQSPATMQQQPAPATMQQQHVQVGMVQTGMHQMNAPTRNTGDMSQANIKLENENFS